MKQIVRQIVLQRLYFLHIFMTNINTIRGNEDDLIKI